MNLFCSKTHIGMLSLLTAVFGIIDFCPSYGPPFFRYTGSDPKHHVWNLGWPFAWSIYDKDTPPHWFTLPVVLTGLLVLQGVNPLVLLANAIGKQRGNETLRRVLFVRWM